MDEIKNDTNFIKHSFQIYFPIYTQSYRNLLSNFNNLEN